MGYAKWVVMNRNHTNSDGEPMTPEQVEERINTLDAMLRAELEHVIRLREELSRKEQLLHLRESQHEELVQLTRRLAMVNAEAAELMAELDERNTTLKRTNLELARANSYAAELMAALEIKDEEISRLNRSIAQANARAAQILGERELQLEELDKMRSRLIQEISQKEKAEVSLRLLTDSLKITNEAVERITTLDSLTQLVNRRGLGRQLKVMIRRAVDRGLFLGVFVVDIDGLSRKRVPQEEWIGNSILMDVSNRLAQILSMSDCLGRLEMDNFVAVKLVADRDELVRQAENLCEVFNSQATLGQPPATISIGAGLAQPDQESVDFLLERIDLSLRNELNEDRRQVLLVLDP